MSGGDHPHRHYTGEKNDEKWHNVGQNHGDLKHHHFDFVIVFGVEAVNDRDTPCIKPVVSHGDDGGVGRVGPPGMPGVKGNAGFPVSGKILKFLHNI